jgi:hypothetical protein
MEQHSLAILALTDSWNFPNTKQNQESGKQGGKLESVTSKLLYNLILESEKLGGEVLNQFWKQLGACDEKLRENSESKF